MNQDTILVGYTAEKLPDTTNNSSITIRILTMEIVFAV